MLTLTENAQVAIRSLVAPSDGATDPGVRIATAPGGNGASPQLALSVVGEPVPGDQIVDEGGARVYLDAAAAEMLIELTLDAQVDPAEHKVDFFVA